MIVASHQPNFLPYPGFFYKMYLADVFTLSDAVKFSSSNYHNYNFFPEDGRLHKVTVPVSSHSASIKDVKIDQWERFSKKLIKRIVQDYSKAPHFDEVFPELAMLLTAKYSFLKDLNTCLILFIHHGLKMDSKVIFEAPMNLQGSTPTEQIIDICEKTGCDTYLSGDGASDYLDVWQLNQHGIGVVWSDYKPLEYGSLQNASMIDYIMKCGFVVPEEWKARKEALSPCRK